MGACFSAAPAHIVSVVNGDHDDFHKRFLEDQVLGEGEFGQVKMVHDISVASDDAASIPFACKVLRKGITFKDNVVYSPLKPETLQSEVNILRVLAGQHYCLRLIAVYESPRLIYMVTEFCGGGEMMEYVSAQPEDLRTEDVSRIAFQILSAVAHCESHSVMHRDIKPENVMFLDANPKASLRLIDFGSGHWDEPRDTTNSIHSESTGNNGITGSNTNNNNNAGAVIRDSKGKELAVHTTFAGSGFYVSPEMFQRSYTLRTDVWSAGVTLYILVAGYPSEALQTAFNLLQNKHKQDRNLRNLPNMPPDLPESFYELLEGMLTHRHTKRPSAGELLKNEFVLFHKHVEHDEDNVGLSVEDIATAAMSSDHPSGIGSSHGGNRSASIRLRGSVGRHSVILSFKKFERSLTALLAAMLPREKLDHFLKIVDERIDAKIASSHLGDDDPSENASKSSSNNNNNNNKSTDASIIAAGGQDAISQEQKLRVIPVKELKAILKDELKNDAVVSAMEHLTNECVYGNYAYHVTLLKDICHDNVMSDGKRQRDAARSRSVIMRNASLSQLNPSGRFMGGSGGMLGHNDGTNNSAQSAASLRFGRNSNNDSTNGVKSKQDPSSVHGSNVFSTIGRGRPGARRTQSVYLPPANVM